MHHAGRDVQSSVKHHSAMNRVMLRFRPIAPKPTVGEVVSAAAEHSAAVKISGVRKKRKYVRVRPRKNTKKRGREAGRPSPPEKSGVEDDSPPEKGVATLQPMLERSESGESCGDGCIQKVQEKNWNLADDEVNCKADCGRGAAEALRSARSVISTWIIVECVTDTFIDGGVGLGFTDCEKINNLRADTCPGFVSDGTNNVLWVNEAYRKMVAEGEAGETQIVVCLAVKDELPNFIPSFACRVRMSLLTGHGHKWNRIVACDVWRMEFAGLAWKLDVNTALGLGI